MQIHHRVGFPANLICHTSNTFIFMSSIIASRSSSLSINIKFVVTSRMHTHSTIDDLHSSLISRGSIDLSTHLVSMCSISTLAFIMKQLARILVISPLLKHKIYINTLFGHLDSTS